MNIAIFLGHPAHFHLFKNAARSLQSKGHAVHFLIKQKDILETLVQEAGFSYTIIREKERKAVSKPGLLLSLLKMDLNMFWYLLKNKPDLLIGTYISLTNRLAGVSFISVNEDDAAVVPFFVRLSYPMAHDILTPIVCDNGKWDKKSVKYESYHELAYLHPNHFVPDKTVVNKYFSADKPYFIIRFAKLTAHHDNGIEGIGTQIALKLIAKLEQYGDIYITSERPLDTELEPYRIKINPIDMHHVMAFADLYIGDSQTMAAEAGVLGIPFIRFNDFVGRIGYLKELEEKYKLGFGVRPSNVAQLYNTLDDLLKMEDRKVVFEERRKVMLSEKIDYAAFLSWYIENYPESKKIMKDKPDFQYQFK